MNITFVQADGSKLEWPGFKLDRLLTTEAEAIEKRTQLTFTDWGQSLMNGGAAASRGLVWVLRKRTEPTLQYKDVDFPIGDLQIELEEDEKERIREEIRTNPTLTDEEREQLLASVGPAPEDEPAGDDEDEDGPGNGSGSASASDVAGS